MCADARSIREVVRALMASGAGALAEFKELRVATQEILKTLRNLDGAARDLARDVSRVAASEEVPPPPIVIAMHERIAFVSTLAAQVFAAFREFDRGMDGWGLDGLGSVKPEGSSSN